MRKLTIVTVLLTLMAISGYGFRPPTTNIVNSSIEISDSTGAFSLAGDGVAYQNGINSVVSQIQGIGDWELNMLASTNRRVNVTFDDPVTVPAGIPTPMSGLYPVRFITQCTQYGFNLLNLTSVGQTATCGMIVRVETGSEVFSLRFFTQNFPGSDNISVGCTAVAAGKCSSWRTQSPNGTGKRIARVQKITTVRNKQVLTDYGLYRFSFDMSFSKP